MTTTECDKKHMSSLAWWVMAVLLIESSIRLVFRYGLWGVSMILGAILIGLLAGHITKRSKA